MDEKLAASDWATERGQKWHDQLEGLEAMLDAVDAPLIDALQLDAPDLDAPCAIADIACGGAARPLRFSAGLLQELASMASTSPRT